MAKKTVTVQIRVSAEAKAEWVAHAQAEGWGLSEWIRTTLNTQTWIEHGPARGGGPLTVVVRPRCEPHRGLLPCVQCAGSAGAIRASEERQG